MNLSKNNDLIDKIDELDEKITRIAEALNDEE